MLFDKYVANTHRCPFNYTISWRDIDSLLNNKIALVYWEENRAKLGGKSVREAQRANLT